MSNILTNIFGGGYYTSTTMDYDTIYVNEKGDSMRGNLNMKNYRILNLGEAVENDDAINKKYCDKKINQEITGLRNENELIHLTFVEKNDMKNYVNNPIIEDLNMKNKNIINLAAPESKNDAVN